MRSVNCASGGTMAVSKTVSQRKPVKFQFILYLHNWRKISTYYPIKKKRMTFACNNKDVLMITAFIKLMKKFLNFLFKGIDPQEEVIENLWTLPLQRKCSKCAVYELLISPPKRFYSECIYLVPSSLVNDTVLLSHNNCKEINAKLTFSLKNQNGNFVLSAQTREWN